MQLSLSVSKERDGVSRFCGCGDSRQLGGGGEARCSLEWHGAGDGVWGVFPTTGVLRQRNLRVKQKLSG